MAEPGSSGQGPPHQRPLGSGAEPGETGAGAAPARRGLLLAVAAGLCAALALGGGGLLWSGYRAAGRPVDCSQLTSEECAMEEGIAATWAQHQVSTGTVLMLVGTAMGLALLLTERRRAARKE